MQNDLPGIMKYISSDKTKHQLNLLKVKQNNTRLFFKLFFVKKLSENGEGREKNERKGWDELCIMLKEGMRFKKY